MKVALVTLADKAIADSCKDFCDNKIDYARTHSYDFFCGGSANPEFPASWEKLRIIDKFLYLDYDFIIWADMDCAFMNFNVEATTLLKQNAWLGACKEFTRPVGGIWPAQGFEAYICCCYMVLRNTPQAKQLIKKAIELSYSVDRFIEPWEQAVINDLLATEKYAGVKLWEPHEIGGGWPAKSDEGYIGWSIAVDGGYRGWQSPELLLHLAGPGAGSCIPWEIRSREFREKYKPQVIR